MNAPIAASATESKGKSAGPCGATVTGIFTMLRQTSAMTSSPPRRPREHKRTAVDLDVIVNGVLNHIGGRITDLSAGGARIDGASLPERARCEIHFGGPVVLAGALRTGGAPLGN